MTRDRMLSGIAIVGWVMVMVMGEVEAEESRGDVFGAAREGDVAEVGRMLQARSLSE